MEITGKNSINLRLRVESKMQQAPQLSFNYLPKLPIFVGPPGPKHKLVLRKLSPGCEQVVMDPARFQSRIEILCGRFENSADRQLVRTAFSLAWRGHCGQFRKDGNAYIDHPVSAAESIASWSGDATEIAAALCHDLLEDGRIGGNRVTREFLSEQLGERVTRLIEGVTELGKEPEAAIANPSLANIYRCYIEKGIKDPAIFRIKLADRLHNMRTLAYTEPQKRQLKAEETLKIYSRIADILGMWQVRRELEDLAFRYLEPQKYQEVKSMRAKVIAESLGRIRGIAFRLNMAFDRAGLPVELKMEKRAVYELLSRIRQREIKSLSPTDVWRLNIFVADVPACYAALGQLHATYRPVQGEFRNYIAAPRPNGHRFLHDFVEVPGFRLLVQVRDLAMKREYEFGVVKKEFTWLNALKQYLQREGVNEKKIYDMIAAVSMPIVVYTARGQRVQLPFGSTVLDFARHQGEDVFLTARNARIHNAPVPLFQELRDGDTVAIDVGPAAAPEIGWLEWVRTPLALATLRGYLKRRSDSEISASAIRYLDEETQKHYLPARLLIKSDLFAAFLRDVRQFRGQDEFLYQVGTGEVKTRKLVNEFMALCAREVSARCTERPEQYRYLVVAEDRPGLLGDITALLKEIGINLSQGFFFNYSNERKTGKGEILLVMEGVAGPAGAIQQLQIETIINKTRGVESFSRPSEKEVRQFARDYLRRNR